MPRIILDSNIWNALAGDERARARVQYLVDQRALRVLIPDTLLRELQKSPWKGVPEWFPTENASDSVFVAGHSRAGRSRVSDGGIYSAHKGESRQVADAMLADFASKDADIFVTEDRRARKRYLELVPRGEALTYDEFVRKVLALSADST